MFFVAGHFIQTPNEHNHEILPTKSTSSIEYIPCQPHDEWLQQLVGYNIASLACGGQHTFVIVNGTNIAHSIGRALLRENELFTQKAFKEIDSDDNDEVSNFSSFFVVIDMVKII